MKITLLDWCRRDSFAFLLPTQFCADPLLLGLAHLAPRPRRVLHEEEEEETIRFPVRKMRKDYTTQLQ